MILSDKRILEEIDKGTIKIEPYSRECLGSNSYDVHLGKWLATYREHILDAKKHNEIEYFEIPNEGLCCTRIYFTSAPPQNTQKHMHMFRSWKAKALRDDWV
jgi:dCTP deaminase